MKTRRESHSSRLHDSNKAASISHFATPHLQTRQESHISQQLQKHESLVFRHSTLTKTTGVSHFATAPKARESRVSPLHTYKNDRSLTFRNNSKSTRVSCFATPHLQTRQESHISQQLQKRRESRVSPLHTYKNDRSLTFRNNSKSTRVSSGPLCVFLNPYFFWHHYHISMTAPPLI